MFVFGLYHPSNQVSMQKVVDERRISFLIMVSKKFVILENNYEIVYNSNII